MSRNRIDVHKEVELNKVEAYLQQVFKDYADEYEDLGFNAMVKLFAEDDFYKAHHEAKRYIELMKIQWDVTI